MVRRKMNSARTAKKKSERRKATRNESHRPHVYYVLSSEQFPLPELVQYGVLAEKAGFDGVWTSDHFQPWQPNEGHSSYAPITLAAVSQRTSRIIMGTGVTCPSFRYRPAIVAQAWASLSNLAPGRVFLGLGAGENLNEGAAGGGWAAYGERASRLIEAVNIIRALWTGSHVKMKGQFWNVNGRLYDPPSSPIPVYIAAGGLNSARIAGRYGEGLIAGAGDFKNDPGLKTAWEEGVRAKGGNPRKESIVVEHWVVVGGEREARAAAQKWRFLPRAWQKGFFDNISPSDIQTRAEREIPLETVTENWTVGRSPRTHIDAIEELADLGATHVVVHCASPNQRKVISFFGRKVLTRLLGHNADRA